MTTCHRGWQELINVLVKTRIKGQSDPHKEIRYVRLIGKK